MKDSQNPFLSLYGGTYCGAVSVSDRLHRVKDFNVDQLRAALAVPDLQSTVKQAVERRLRKLEKGAHT